MRIARARESGGAGWPGNGCPRRRRLAAAVAFAGASGSAATAPAPKKEDAVQTSRPPRCCSIRKATVCCSRKTAISPSAPASLAKLMTLEYVFNEMKKGTSSSTIRSPSPRTPGARGGALARIDHVRRASIAAWSAGSDPGHHRRFSQRRLHRALPRVSPVTKRRSRQMLTKRAREIGLENSTFTNSTGYSDPNLARDRARPGPARAPHHADLSRFLSVFLAERDFAWNNIHQQNRNPLLGMGIGADG